MIDVVFMGCSTELLQSLSISDTFHITKVITIKHRITPEFQEIIDDKKYPSLILHTKDDLSKIKEFVGSCKLILIYSFDYILSEEFVKNRIVINFHSGNLRTNRGAHPIVWSILNQNESTTLSIYRLTGGIDEGILIYEYTVPISDSDNTLTINAKLSSGISDGLEAIERYISGQISGVDIYGGIYHRKVTENDYTITENDSFGSAYAKIRSQMFYNGAIYYNQKRQYRIKDFIVENCNETEISFTFQNNQLVIKGDGRQIVCTCVSVDNCSYSQR